MILPKRSLPGLALFVVLARTLVPAPAQNPEEAGFAPLWAYNGQWKIESGGKSQVLVNQCALNGHYFTCQQSVNGAVSELLVIVSSGSSGHFSTQSILPDGRAGGKGGLEVSGNLWTFTSSWNQGGRSTFYKTINTFSGQTKIHFEQQESSNNSDWKTTKTGDEVRMKAGLKTVVR